jgi:selenocysteine-specific elongation factor
MIIATAGHIDHGKTSLIKALTGIETDRLPEERKRGLTIDLGFAYHDLGNGASTGFIDVPGHERFIRTMIAGAVGIDAVLFIIAADDGPMLQSAEHLAILELLDVTHGVVALTKIDRVSEERLAEVRQQCSDLFEATSLSHVPIIPVSVTENIGIDTLRTHLVSMVDGLPQRPQNGNFRLAVDRSFLLKGAGRIVTGTVFSGTVSVDDELCHVPFGSDLRVRSLHAQNAQAGSAGPGQRAALNVVGVKRSISLIHRGDWIVSPSTAITSTRLDICIRVLDTGLKPVMSRIPVHVHVGAADVTGRLIIIDGKSIPPGGSAYGHLILDNPVHAVKGDRVILRDQSARETLAGGYIVDVSPSAYKTRFTTSRGLYLDALNQRSVLDSFSQLLALSPVGLDLRTFGQNSNLTTKELSELQDKTGNLLVLPELNNLGFDKKRWQTLQGKVASAIKSIHAKESDQASLSESDIGQELDERITPRLLKAIVDSLVFKGVVERINGAVRLPSFKAKRSEADERLWLRVEPLMSAPDFKVPVLHDLHELLKIDLKILEAFLMRSAREGFLVQISKKRYLLPSSVVQLKNIALAIVTDSEGGTFSVADFRNNSGIGRNAVVEILEYFDRIKFTYRDNEARKIIGK